MKMYNKKIERYYKVVWAGKSGMVTGKRKYKTDEAATKFAKGSKHQFVWVIPPDELPEPITRKQLVRRVASLLGVRNFKVRVAPSFSFLIEAEWAANLGLGVVITSPEIDFPMNLDTLNKFYNIDFSKLLNFNKATQNAYIESDRQAKEAKVGYQEYFEDILEEAYKLRLSKS